MRHLSPTHAVLGWFTILAAAIGNGGLREEVLIPHLGATAGTAISGVLLSIAVCIVATLLLRWRRPRLPIHAAWLGLGWFLATLAFEFGFGLLLQRKSMAELLGAYTFEGGNLWPVVLLTLLVAPFVVARLDRRTQVVPRVDA